MRKNLVIIKFPIGPNYFTLLLKGYVYHYEVMFLIKLHY